MTLVESGGASARPVAEGIGRGAAVAGKACEEADVEGGVATVVDEEEAGEGAETDEEGAVG